MQGGKNNMRFLQILVKSCWYGWNRCFLGFHSSEGLNPGFLSGFLVGSFWQAKSEARLRSTTLGRRGERARDGVGESEQL